MTGIRQAGGRVTGVDTADGAVRAEFVVNCAGVWAREVGRMAGVNVPLMAAEHFYVVTDASPDIPRNLPVLRVPDECAYVKEEAGKLLVGFFEPKGKPLPDHKIPDDSEFLTLPDDWDHLARELELASERLPILKRIGPHLLQRPGEHRPTAGGFSARPHPCAIFRCRLQLDRHQTARGRVAIAEWMQAGEPTLDSRAATSAASPFHGNVTYHRQDRRSPRPHYADQFPIAAPRARAAYAPRRCTGGPRRGACFAGRPAGRRAAWFPPEAARARGGKPSAATARVGRAVRIRRRGAPGGA